MSQIVKAYPRRTNVPMLLMIFAVVMFGLIILYSVSGPAGYAKPIEERSSMFYVGRQIAFTVFGLILMLIINFIPVNFFKSKFIWMGSYILSLLAVLSVEAFGYTLNGAKRWILVGSTTVQPSEFVKFLLIIFVAGYSSWIKELKKSGRLKQPSGALAKLLSETFFEFLLPVGLAGVIDIFIAAQPHMSCALIVAAIVFLSMVNAGVRLRAWITGAIIVIPIAVLGLGIYFTQKPDALDNFSHVFQRIRVFSAVHGDEDADVTEDDLRQVTNAHNALGSGGMWGRGLGNSRAKYNYVSEAQNDYIFSIYVEETGFVGGTLLILMYMTMFAMCFMVVIRADSNFSRILAVGCTAIPMVQFLLNIAVELQVIPSTGVTLPFVSYGGTAQLALLITYGIILSVSRSGTVPRGVPRVEE